ncbi:hypothetical protein FNV43_RR01193 [Rhamnella rubrinervis]|uniref:Glycosyl transferase family 1 domain-containing protein n=1 Tax=Rhamnella rubrinervis TaxID=2594499 RepID=A0A8K0HRV1_9ROSA|nr:hypothetical protein FNV43_RR01193 [Rhamnella rubrinervis]
MGSLESGATLKRDPLLRSSSSTGRAERHPFLQRQRSRLSRFFFLRKLDYLQWICTVAVFLFFVVLFQMFLPGSMIEKSGNAVRDAKFSSNEFVFLRTMSLLLAAFCYCVTISLTSFLFEGFADLLIDSQQLLMVTIAAALREIGYVIQVYSLEDGPVHNVWRYLGVPVSIVQTCDEADITVDWLNYDGILVNSLEAKGIFSWSWETNFMSHTLKNIYIVERICREPFKSVPLIWTIHERALATRSRKYTSNRQIELLNDWKRVFNRSTVVVFPNYVLPMLYSTFDAGNFFVIPGSPAEAWKTETLMALDKDYLRGKVGCGPEDVVITIVGSEFLYRGLWLEHSIVLRALLPLLEEFSLDNNSSRLKIIVLSGDLASNYSSAVEAMALNLKYPDGLVKHVSIDADADSVITTSDVVVYGSLLEEQSFPDILIKAMCLGKPIIAPNLSMIRKYSSLANCYASDLKGKTIISSPQYGFNGKSYCKNLMALESVEGYALLLENVFRFPSEVAPPKDATEVPLNMKEKWQWNLFESVSNFTIWEEQKHIEIANARKRREEEELKDRTDQYHATWEDVYRNAKRADRTKNDLHERDEGELERTGQPLCIYEPYLGEGTWPFLHRTSLYRGIGLPFCNCKPDRPYAQKCLDRIWILESNCKEGIVISIAENALLDAIQAQRHGDALYFWVRMDMDLRNPLKQDFWSFCDALNAGNCKFAFSEAFKRMYGLKHDLNRYHPCLTSIVTHAFLNYLLMSGRTTVPGLMVYVNPETGLMQEQHRFKSRRGQTWIKWFSYPTLKNMDEDLAEEADSDQPKRRWLWPSTGEVFGMAYMRERELKTSAEGEEEAKSREKLGRMRRRNRQKVIGKYVKPPPEETENSNATLVTGV